MAARSTAPEYVGRRGGQVIAASAAKNLDLGLSGAYYFNNSKSSAVMPARPAGLNPTGRDTLIKLNTFSVAAFPNKPVYQYDVAVGNDMEKRQIIKRIWESPSVQTKLGAGWVWDGNKIAWSMNKMDGSLGMMVDLDKEYGRTPRMKDGQPVPDVYRFAVKMAKEVNFGALRKWLAGELQDDIPLHAITFLDGLMRQTPMNEFTPIKRQFFNKGQARLNDKPFDLGGGLEAYKGVYESLRPALTGPGTTNLSVNVDVANGTFWPMVSVNKALALFLGARDDGNELINLLNTFNMAVNQGISRLKRVHVECTYRRVDNKIQLDKHSIEAVQLQHNASMSVTIGEGTAEQRSTTVAGYLKERYGVTLKYPKLPLLKMQGGKGNTFIPMELCTIQENERYMYKLNERQTSQMINFAVTVPAVRWAAIQRGVNMLSWGKDKYLKNYGLVINDKPTTVKAKVLPNPKVVFQGAGPSQTADPRTSGRWDLRGKKFCQANTNILSWGVMFVEGRGGCTKDSVSAFVKTLITVGTGHGLRYSNKNPLIVNCPSAAALPQYMPKFFQATGDAVKQRPQLLVFVVNDKSSDNYLMIKKFCDTEAGCPSQVLQSRHVQQNQAQYCSNVSMKINAKLGGYTAEAQGQKKANSWFSIPTMIIGADVSHGVTGAADQQSVAAMTMSWDKKAIKYTAVCETNGVRTEFLTEENINTKLKFLAEKWNATLGLWPQHVIYMRDGVSDGQYAGVLEQEVKTMRNMMDQLDPKGAATRKWTAIIGSKRHNIRFFPDKDGDRNGNPLPGTLVETGCTHPWEYDFYLCSHSAIKGTARPVHYHVLLDEKKMSQIDLQNMIYEASYQYVRSTTPISQHPAMYYAHLAAARAMAHIQPKENKLLALKPGVAPYMWFC